MYKRRMNFFDIIMWSFDFFSLDEDEKMRERERDSLTPFSFTFLHVQYYICCTITVWPSWSLMKFINSNEYDRPCQGLNITYHEPEIHSTCWSCTNSLPFLCNFLLGYKHACQSPKFVVVLWLVPLCMWCTCIKAWYMYSCRTVAPRS